jgi:hypothetical protein
MLQKQLYRFNAIAVIPIGPVTDEDANLGFTLPPVHLIAHAVADVFPVARLYTKTQAAFGLLP